MKIFIGITIVFVSLVLVLDQLVDRMFRQEIKKHRQTPEKYQVSFDEIRIPGINGAQLYGWWIPTSPEAPTLVLVHGWGRNLERMLPYIKILHPAGYNLLAFDARNHGSSSQVKRPTVGTFTEDILVAVEHIVNSGWVNNDRIGVLGLSVGGGAAINAASFDNRIKAVVTVGAFSHPIEVMKLEFVKRNIPDFISSLLLGYTHLRFGIDFEKIAPVNKINLSNADILLIHGNKDETIPLSQGQALYSAGNGEKTQLWIVPGKGHGNCNSHPQFWENIETFLQVALPV